MRRRIGVILAAGVTMLAVFGSAAAAEAANFSPAPGAYTVDTTGLVLTAPGTSIEGSAVDGVAVFSFDNINIQAGMTITARRRRSRPPRRL